MGDKRTWNLDRGEALGNLLAKYGLHLRPCKKLYSGNDHVYSTKPVLWEYEYFSKSVLKTDHGFILMEVKTTNNIPYQTASRRYAYSTLQDKTLRELLKQDWLSSQIVLTECIGHISYKIKVKKIAVQEKIESIIEVTYGLFIAELISICDRHLPVYNPDTIQSKEDRSIISSGSPSNREIIRLFKRSQRAYAQLQRFVASGKKDLFSETISHFSSLYGGDHATRSSFTYVYNELTRTNGSEVKEVLKKYSSAKSGGPDGISTTLLKCLSEVTGFNELIADLFNLFLEHSTTPEAWNISNIHLLLKDPTKPFVQNSRPVSLTNILRRLFEKILLKKLIDQPWAQLNPNQAGFRKGWSTNSHILLNDELCRSQFSITAYLDMKNAFDTVDHGHLLRILQKRETPKWIQNMIYSLMLKNCKSVISVNKTTLKEEIQRTRGLFQGSILSPFLFNLVIDELATMVNLKCPSVCMLLFADDIAIKAKCWTSLQVALDECFAWSSQAKTKWGIKKCGVLTKNDYFPVLLGEEIIQPMQHYKYLGLPFGANGVDWRIYLTQIVSKFNTFLRGITSQKMVWNYCARIQIYKTFIRPIMEYGMPLLTKWISKQTDSDHLLGKLQTLHTDGITWIFDKHGTKAVLESLSGIGPLSFRIKQLECSMATHIRNLNENNPLNSHWNANFLSANKNFILSAVRKSKLLGAWNTYQKQEKFHLKFCTWLKHEKIKSSLEYPGILQHFIIKKCRGRSGIDQCLTLDLKTSRKALSWRCNRSFSHGLCPNCRQGFTRGHLDRCGLYRLMQLDLEETLESEEYQLDIKSVMDSLKVKKVNMFTYTVLDFFLNHKKYDKFLDCYNALKKILVWKENSEYIDVIKSTNPSLSKKRGFTGGGLG